MRQATWEFCGSKLSFQTSAAAGKHHFREVLLPRQLQHDTDYMHVVMETREQLQGSQKTKKKGVKRVFERTCVSGLASRSLGPRGVCFCVKPKECCRNHVICSTCGSLAVQLLAGALEKVWSNQGGFLVVVVVVVVFGLLRFSVSYWICGILCVMSRHLFEFMSV